MAHFSSDYFYMITIIRKPTKPNQTKCIGRSPCLISIIMYNQVKSSLTLDAISEYLYTAAVSQRRRRPRPRDDYDNNRVCGPISEIQF